MWLPCRGRLRLLTGYFRRVLEQEEEANRCLVIYLNRTIGNSCLGLLPKTWRLEELVSFQRPIGSRWKSERSKENRYVAKEVGDTDGSIMDGLRYKNLSWLRLTKVRTFTDTTSFKEDILNSTKDRLTWRISSSPATTGSACHTYPGTTQSAPRPR